MISSRIIAILILLQDLVSVLFTGYLTVASRMVSRHLFICTDGRVRTDYLHKAQKYVETAMQSAQYTIDNATSASEKSKATKAVTKYTKQLAEMKIYDEAIAHVANQRIEIDLDDGVKVNYAKFQGVEVAQEGKIALKVDLLAKI